MEAEKQKLEMKEHPHLEMKLLGPLGMVIATASHPAGGRLTHLAEELCSKKHQLESATGCCCHISAFLTAAKDPRWP